MTALRSAKPPDPAAVGNVVSLRRHGDYRPDMSALACEQIATARRKLGLTHAGFAATLADLLDWEPSAAAVESWESGITPPGDVILAAGFASQDHPDVLAFGLSSKADKVMELLTAMASEHGRITGDPDVVCAYATRRHLARPEWQNIIRDCRAEIVLTGLSEQGYALDKDVPGIFEQAATGGCSIRVLLLDPEYRDIGEIDRAEGNPVGTLAARIRSSLHMFREMAARCGGRMQVRTYRSAPSVSVVRGDDAMLVTQFVTYLRGGDSPTWLLKRHPDGQLFGNFEYHYRRLWTEAEEALAA